MGSSFKYKSFKFVFWIIFIFLVADTLDTSYRFVVIGYFGDGASFPGAASPIKPDKIDLVVFLIVQIGIVSGIYFLYKLKRVGGYIFIVSNLFFLVYASFFGPIAEIGISNIFVPVFVYFSLYVFFALVLSCFYYVRFK